MKEKLRSNINVAAKREKADLVLKNGKIIDVFNLEIIDGDIAINNGYIVGIGKYDGNTEVDLQGKYVSPGFIDGHMHIESVLIPPSEFAKVVAPKGITSVIADPHEIANVLGVEGIQYMLTDSINSPTTVYMMLPSCVPCTPFESAGARLTHEDLRPFYANPRVLGLAEVMDFPSVRDTDDSMLDKLLGAKRNNKKIDGHAAGLDGDAINVYKTAGISTDHESTTAEQAKERLRRGMYLMIREGSVAKDMDSLIHVITPQNARRCILVTDDMHLDELIEHGGIDHTLRLAIKKGIEPLQAIQMVTLNTCECFGLQEKGAVAPGYVADLVILDDLERLRVNQVYKDGILVAKEGALLNENVKSTSTENLSSSIDIPFISKDSLAISVLSKANVMEIIPNSISTNHLVMTVPTVGGHFIPSIEHDLAKIVVLERHKGLGNIGLGIVKGLGIKAGAIATTVAHDSHNLIATGSNDSDILLAIEECSRIGGGFVLVKEGQILATVALPIAGLMSDKPYQAVNKELHYIHEQLKDLGVSGQFNPLLTLSFLALPVIPTLKITDKGLFDVIKGVHIAVCAD